MAIIKLDMQRFVTRKTGEPVASIGKNGSFSILPALQQMLGYKIGDGIALGYDDQSSKLFLFLDQESPIKLKLLKKKDNSLGFVSRAFVEGIRTYLKVPHNNTFRVTFEKRLFKNIETPCWEFIKM